MSAEKWGWMRSHQIFYKMPPEGMLISGQGGTTFESNI
jgi:hypothetical protein